MKRMNIAELQQQLISAARKQAADDRVPYAFEKRIVALVAGRAAESGRLLWARGLWRAAVSCVVLAVICGVFSLFTPVGTDTGNDLSQDFENTLLASVDQPDTNP
jgi:hypothetical protein